MSNIQPEWTYDNDEGWLSIKDPASYDSPEDMGYTLMGKFSGVALLYGRLPRPQFLVGAVIAVAELQANEETKALRKRGNLPPPMQPVYDWILVNDLPSLLDFRSKFQLG